MRKSRVYQNKLQVAKSLSYAVLYAGGLFLTKEEIKTSVLFLVLSLLLGYLCSDFKYKRYQEIIKEFRGTKIPLLKHSKFYQFWVQITGRGEKLFVFLIGVFLGSGFSKSSIILIVLHLINGIVTSELIYRREQAVLLDKYLKRNLETLKKEQEAQHD